MLEAEYLPGGEIAFLLRVFDGMHCRWDVVDTWSGSGDEGGVSLQECMLAFEDLVLALARSRGVQLTLPFP